MREKTAMKKYTCVQISIYEVGADLIRTSAEQEIQEKELIFGFDGFVNGNIGGN